LKLKVSEAELRALFEGPSRMEGKAIIHGGYHPACLFSVPVNPHATATEAQHIECIVCR